MRLSLAVSFLRYIFKPFSNFLVAVFLVLFFFLLEPYITAYRMDIPKKNDLVLIVGTLSDTTKHAYKKNTFGVSIIDANRDEHYCNCEISGNPNCFSGNNRTNAEMIQGLAGKDMFVWVYPSKSLTGTEYTCYEISDGDRVYRSYEQSVGEYLGARKSIGAMMAFLYLFCIFGILCVRSLIFITATWNEKSKIEAQSVVLSATKPPEKAANK
jgi:hypothetical protein